LSLLIFRYWLRLRFFITIAFFSLLVVTDSHIDWLHYTYLRIIDIDFRHWLATLSLRLHWYYVAIADITFLDSTNSLGHRYASIIFDNSFAHCFRWFSPSPGCYADAVDYWLHWCHADCHWWCFLRHWLRCYHTLIIAGLIISLLRCYSPPPHYCHYWSLAAAIDTLIIGHTSHCCCWYRCLPLLLPTHTIIFLAIAYWYFSPLIPILLICWWYFAINSWYMPPLAFITPLPWLSATADAMPPVFIDYATAIDVDSCFSFFFYFHHYRAGHYCHWLPLILILLISLHWNITPATGHDACHRLIFIADADIAMPPAGWYFSANVISSYSSHIYWWLPLILIISYAG